MAHLLRKVKTAFINDFKSGMSTKDLVSKYNFPSERSLHYMVYYFRKKGLIPQPQFKSSRKVKKATVKQDNNVVNEFRTVFFQDFSIQLHKNANSRVVVDKNNNVHILNN